MDNTCRVNVLQSSLQSECRTEVSPVILKRNNNPQMAYQDLVQKVLDELLLQRPRGQETVQVGSQKLGNKVAVRDTQRSKRLAISGAGTLKSLHSHVLQGRDEDVAQRDDLRRKGHNNKKSVGRIRCYHIMVGRSSRRTIATHQIAFQTGLARTPWVRPSVARIISASPARYANSSSGWYP